MSTINNYICPIYNLADILYEIGIDMHKELIDESYKKVLNDYLHDFKDNLYCYIEFPYVDSMYRDSYYLFYSSKHLSYDRDCIRISFFGGEITLDNFLNKEKVPTLQNLFLGYLVIRPIPYAPIGRSMLSPNAFKKNNFIIETTSINCLINGIKFSILGFPHASQNTETISCAETSVWIISEYFNKKYKDYRKILPSDIQYLLSNFSYERSIPSHGLTAFQISYLLKKIGFGTRIYSNTNTENFEKIFNYYIESGIPIIATIQNKNIAHAVVYVGHENIKKTSVNTVSPEKFKNLIFYDTATIQKKYIAMDDNYPPYQQVFFNNPTEYYSNPKFENANINNFIVPLYPKIYLEASEARYRFLNFLNDKIYGYNSPDMWLRFFLTSSRSFKNSLLKNDSMDKKLKQILISKTMPKFIWIAEITNKKLYLDQKANGLIILDATTSVYQNFVDFIFILYENKYMNLDLKEWLTHKFGNFDIYKNNLKGEVKWRIL